MKNTSFVYIGTHSGTPENSLGVYAFCMDNDTGELTPLGNVAAGSEMVYQAISSCGRYLYSISGFASDSDDEVAVGYVSAYIIKPDGSLEKINSSADSKVAACHISVSDDNKFLFTANYKLGTVTQFSLRDDGGIDKRVCKITHNGSSIDPVRQTHPYAHFVAQSPGSNHVYVADLGMDKIVAYDIDKNSGALVQNDALTTAMTPGSGPRHIAFHKNGKFMYIINELANSVTVLTQELGVRRQETGVPAWVGAQKNSQMTATTNSQLMTANSVHSAHCTLHSTSTIPSGHVGFNSGAAIHLSPCGGFLYASNRGHNSLAIYKVDQNSGELSHICYTSSCGAFPRDFAIHPNGRFMIVANQLSNGVCTYEIDKNSGRITQIGQIHHVPSPICVKIRNEGLDN